MLSLQKQISWLARVQWLLLSLMFLLCAGFYLLIYRPQTQKLADLRINIDSSQRELRASQNETKMLPSVALEVERLKERVRKFKSLPKQGDLWQFRRDIAQLAQQASLQKWDVRENTVVRGERLNEEPITISFEGDFVNVFSFLRRAEELPRLTRLPELSIKSRDAQGQVKVKLTMNIYFQAE